MKTPTIPTLLGPDGMTSLREYAGYHGGGSGFGGQLRAWNPPGESVDAALLPNFTRGNARADDLVRNNGYAANAIQLHQDHIVGSFFRLSHRPSWRYLGIGEEEARAFSREVEAAWKEFAEDDCCCIDVERKRTFTMMIREGVAMHAFNGELFVQATWDTSPSRLFRTQFRMVSPKRISNPNNTGDSRNCRAGVQINDSGAALGYYVSEDGYLDFFKGEIGKTHLAQELWTQIDNGQLAPDLAEIRTSITDVSNEITQTVNKKLEDQSAAIQQIQKVQVDTNNNLNSMWAVKLQQMQDGRLYIAGIGAGIENTPDGMQSQVLLAADRIAMINPANGNTKPMFVGQGDQIFMNEVFLKRLTAPTITSGGNPPVFSLTPDGRLTAKNADISGNVNANSGTLNNVTINENCRVLGKLSANQIEGDLVKTVGKAFPRDSRAPERWPSGTITVRVYDDQPFDRQIVIPAVAFSGAKHERENNDIYSSCRLIVRKNGAEIYNRTALDNTLIYSGVIDMPAGHGHMTLEFSVSAWLVNDWYPTASISDLLVVVMKKATAGITIS
ncbi:TPA: phage portal protein [Escherichia coli]